MFHHLHSCLTEVWDALGLSEVSDSVLAGTQLETTPMLATTVKKKKSSGFSVPFLFNLDQRPAERGRGFLLWCE